MEEDWFARGKTEAPKSRHLAHGLIDSIPFWISTPMLARLFTSTTILSRPTFPSRSSLLRAMSLSPSISLKTSFGDLASKLNLSNPDLLRSTNYVDGEWVASSRPESESTFAVRDPATDEIIGHAPDLTAEEVSPSGRRRSKEVELTLPSLSLADSFCAPSFGFHRIGSSGHQGC